MSGWYTIAKWEFLRSGMKFSRRFVLAVLFTLVLLTIVSFAVSFTGMNLDQKIYSVFSTSQELNNIIEGDARFYILTDDGKYADLTIVKDRVYLSGTKKSVSAADALEKVFIAHRETVLASYNDINNSHPVWVTIHDLDRPESFQILGTATQKDGQVSDAGYENTGSIGNYKESTATTGQTSHIFSPEELEDLDNSNSKTLFNRQTIATPSYFMPPIPFTAILYSFLFIFPIYFISQFYSSSILEERVNRRCELLLTAPLKSRDIILGKSIPYVLVTMVLLSVISLYIEKPSNIHELRTSIEMIGVIFPVLLLFFSLSFIAAIFSRSFKELTFAMVFFSVIVSGYLLFPAMFANIHSVSSISPMTLIVNLIEEGSISFGKYIFSTLPFYLVALSIYGFGTAIFREEDLFSQKTMKEKTLDCMELFLGAPLGSVFTLSIVSIPFVYMAQLMLIVMLFNLPLPYSIIVMIILSALVEEIAKSVGIYTIMKRGLKPVNLKTAVLLALLSGGGFFFGEKLVSVITLAPIASSAFGSVMTMGTLLLIPLLLHLVTAMITSLGVYFTGPRYYAFFLLAATGVHAIYNTYLLRGLFFG
ncbi:ABC transporter permease [Methanomethylovorans sp.]|uniref:ABC transporter permease n=1 Tax=Methanomethylovorans sp. TaxID=2758717 RepID=UPI00345E84F5